MAARVRGTILMLTLSTAACAPRMYSAAPHVEVPDTFTQSASWKPSQPQDEHERGAWWQVFGDPQLDALEARIEVSNPTLAAAAARFAQARASVRIGRSNLFPQVTATPSIARLSPSGNRPNAASRATYGDYVLPADVSYEADVWGRIRSTVAASRAAAQASAADLESVRLALHAELAADYFLLRGLDREQRLLEEAVVNFERALDLTRNRFRGGIVSQADVDQAETQLETTRAQAVDVSVDRATFEHAIAVLIGQPASSFTLATSPLDTAPPGIPIGLPSDLLERRPDIAAAERRVVQAGAQVGVANAAFYPILTLSGSIGFESSSFGSWLAAASNFWSIAPAALVTMFDGGRRRAIFEQAKGAYAESEAAYRGAVLDAFREVEDQLSTLRLLEREADIQAGATAAAQRSLAQATNRYQGGVVTYLEVITAQTIALANARAEVSILSRRMSASVLLLKALGGGWQRASLPTDVTKPVAANAAAATS